MLYFLGLVSYRILLATFLLRTPVFWGTPFHEFENLGKVGEWDPRTPEFDPSAPEIPPPFWPPTGTDGSTRYPCVYIKSPQPSHFCTHFYVNMSRFTGKKVHVFWGVFGVGVQGIGSPLKISDIWFGKGAPPCQKKGVQIGKIRGAKRVIFGGCFTDQARSNWFLKKGLKKGAFLGSKNEMVHPSADRFWHFFGLFRSKMGVFWSFSALYSF